MYEYRRWRRCKRYRRWRRCKRRCKSIGDGGGVKECVRGIGDGEGANV